MALTLGSLTLPSGLFWADEYAWSPVGQGIGYSLTGAPIVNEQSRLGGRPITLRGQRASIDGHNAMTSWVLRDQAFLGWASVEALRAALSTPKAFLTLTLHDGRTFRTLPRHDGDGPLRVTALSRYQDFMPADPQAADRYFVDEIRLLHIP